MGQSPSHLGNSNFVRKSRPKDELGFLGLVKYPTNLSQRMTETHIARRDRVVERNW